MSQTTLHHKIGVGTLALLSVSAVISLRNLPMMALQGWSSVFFYLVSGLTFLIPISLACAELTSTWPKQGGVYLWVKEAFGIRPGVVAIWLEWMESVIWLPMVLSFVASLFAYLIDPTLVENRQFLLIVILITLWGLTFLNFLNVEVSAHFSAWGIFLGTLIPGLLIILMAISWIMAGKPTQIPLIPNQIIPILDTSNLVFFTGILLSYAGIEVAAFHVQNTEKPRRNFPIATLMAAAMILFIYILGTLSVALVVPKAHIQLASGPMQAFDIFFDAFQLKWMVQVIAFLSLLGSLALINTWIIGPSRGLHVSAEQGQLPRFCHYKNKHQSPTHILYAQAGIATVLSYAFIFMPSVNASYWLLTTLAAQLIALMYMMIFAAVIRLRYTKPKVERTFKIPGGTLGLWLIAGTGGLASLLAFIVGFFPPEGIVVGDPTHYAFLLAIALIVSSVPPFLWKRRA